MTYAATVESDLRYALSLMRARALTSETREAMWRDQAEALEKKLISTLEGRAEKKREAAMQAMADEMRDEYTHQEVRLQDMKLPPIPSVAWNGPLKWVPHVGWMPDVIGAGTARVGWKPQPAASIVSTSRQGSPWAGVGEGWGYVVENAEWEYMGEQFVGQDSVSASVSVQNELRRGLDY